MIAYFYFPETRRKTLEEIAAAFGDKVVLVEDTQVVAEQAALEDKLDAARVEQKENV